MFPYLKPTCIILIKYELWLTLLRSILPLHPLFPLHRRESAWFLCVRAPSTVIELTTKIFHWKAFRKQTKNTLEDPLSIRLFIARIISNWRKNTRPSRALMTACCKILCINSLSSTWFPILSVTHCIFLCLIDYQYTVRLYLAHIKELNHAIKWANIQITFKLKEELTILCLGIRIDN